MSNPLYLSKVSSMTAFRRSLLITACAFVCLSAAQAFAFDVPSSVAPGQIEKRFEEPLTAPSMPNLQLPTPVEPELSKEAQEALAKRKFTLKEIAFEGVTAYKTDSLAFAYEDKVGQTISLLDANEIARKITRLYHNDGYVLSQAVVPPQDVTNGTLKIKIVEGYVNEVSIQNDNLTAGERNTILSFAKEIKALNPVRTEDLERYLLLINDLPGTSVNGLLRPSPTEFGAAELILSLKSKSFEGSYSLDNRGSRYVGPWQHTTVLAANSLFGLYDRTQIRLFGSNLDTNQLLGAEVTHEEQIGNSGTKLTFTGSHIHTHPGDALSALDIVGTSDMFELKASHPFLRLRHENLIGRVSLSYHDSSTDIFYKTPYSRDRLRVARAGATYNILDDLRGNNLFDVQMSQGMDIFDATSGGINRSNAVGDSSFTKFNFDFSRLQTLPDNFAFLTAMTAQYSLDPLLADEQFGLGGTEYGRAFDSADVLGDSGVAGKVELRYTDTASSIYLKTYQPYAFYDIGRIWIRNGAVGANEKTIRSSTGAGIRLSITDNFSANFEAAVPLISTSDDQTIYRHNPRLFASMTVRF